METASHKQKVAASLDRRGTGTSNLGRWETVSRPPAHGLLAYIHSYTGFQEVSQNAVRRREVPQPWVVMVISLNGSFRVATEGRVKDGPVFTSLIAGLGQGPVLTEHDGIQEGIEVTFDPIGCFALFGVPMSQLSGRVISLNEFLGPEAVGIAEQLACTPGWTERFNLLDEVFIRMIGKGRSPYPEIANAWKRLKQNRGQLPIGDLVKELGWSRHRLSSAFREQVGLVPKVAARLLRFHHATELLMRPNRIPLSSIASEAGYFDQAHFNRDFRPLAGCTPTQYLTAQLNHFPGVGCDA